MKFIKENWKSIFIACLLFFAGIMIASVFRCKPSVVKPIEASIDSLKQANSLLNYIYERKADSIAAEIRVKEGINQDLDRKLKEITAKYILIRNRGPVHDTIVKDTVVYKGNECLEKLPLVESQLLNCQAENTDLHALVIVKTDHNLALQGQFDRSMAINEDQVNEIRKLERKKNANKRWAVITSATTALALVGMFVVR